MTRTFNLRRLAAWAGTVAVTLGLCYAVLLIPDGDTNTPVGANAKAFHWNQDARWDSLIGKFIQARSAAPAVLEPMIDAGLLIVRRQLDTIAATNPEPGASIFDRVESGVFALGPLVAIRHNRLHEYVGLVTQTRSVVKRVSEGWDINTKSARDRLYRLLYGGRFALEEVMLQAPPDSVRALVTVEDMEPSATPSAIVLGMKIHSGDILVSRGGAPTSALIAEGNDYPGNFSHVALAFVDERTGEPWAIESVLESGAHVVPMREYLEDVKLRVMVLRLRADLPAMRTDPMLPHHAASWIRGEVEKTHFPYDLEMDYHDHARLYCAELAAWAYEHEGVALWMGISHISRPGLTSWLHALGVRHFEPKEPSDLEYDPQLRVVAEWRDPHALWTGRLDNAITEIMLDDAESGERLQYAAGMLPAARVMKGYCSVLNSFGTWGRIPEGMTASQALCTEAFAAQHTGIRRRVIAIADSLERAQGFRVIHWQLLKIIRQVKDGLRAEG